MDEILGNAKNILILWTVDADQDKLSAFQDTVRTKSKTAQIAPEKVQDFSQSRRATSSIDLIFFDLINKKDSAIDTDLITQFFRVLRPNGYLFTHIEHAEQARIINNFKMCGFDSCNPLDSNSSFLIENKSDEVKKMGSLWLCQKPSFDIGYSVPLQRPGVALMRQISGVGRGRKMWTVDHDDSEDDSVDIHGFQGADHEQKPNVQNSFGNTKSTNNIPSDTSTSSSSKPSDHFPKPMMSDV
ncbi:unnamed protein product [Adineta ricciae]|uniref:Anamorsin N-terminal domain-containing protein n=1 Tax=Adineta ricciae TaxID=249248 RepID=A0A813ZV46_ADIRI|nr:unnamed protein product [Adineta ricciae]CAF0978989.1 unnamed protein product [Adineta ricciae]